MKNSILWLSMLCVFCSAQARYGEEDLMGSEAAISLPQSADETFVIDIAVSTIENQNHQEVLFYLTQRDASNNSNQCRYRMKSVSITHPPEPQQESDELSAFSLGLEGKIDLQLDIFSPICSRGIGPHKGLFKLQTTDLMDGNYEVYVNDRMTGLLIKHRGEYQYEIRDVKILR